MYLKNDHVSGYLPSGEYVCRRGLFLLLIQPKSYARRNDPIKAIVRKVALHQVGHYMMGTARIYGESIAVSGAYGGNGLPCGVPDAVYDRATVILPEDLRKAWNEGGGWNSAGNEAEVMRRWAVEHLPELRV